MFNYSFTTHRKKNQADFRIVLAEKESPVNKKIVEILGSYNPRKKNFQVKEERVKYWIAQRIEMSETINNLFVTKGLLTDGKKVKAFNIPKKPVEASASPTTPAAVAATPPLEGGDTAGSAETPMEAVEATAQVEAKVEDVPVAETVAEKTVAEDKPAEPIKE